ncbi:hypothetical protein P8X24_06200 [Pyrococcus kukulkanii]|uniref:hypothetical protein n=1 Tax=Pyrococcus kukulkanii TaxID=1609559 RepID=UPI003565C916
MMRSILIILLLLFLYIIKFIISSFRLVARIFAIPLRVTVELPDNKRKNLERFLTFLRYFLSVVLAIKVGGTISGIFAFLGFNSGVGFARDIIYTLHDVRVLKSHGEDPLMRGLGVLATVLMVVEISILTSLTILSKILSLTLSPSTYWVLGLVYGGAYLLVSHNNPGVLQRNSLLLLTFFGVKTGKAKAEEVSRQLSKQFLR